MLRVSATGVGFAEVVDASIAAVDTSWSLSLHVTGQSDTSFSATTDSRPALSLAMLQLTTPIGGMTAAPLDEAAALNTASCTDAYEYPTSLGLALLLDGFQGVYPKDFALLTRA
jgi:hypothetical protein